ncbi:MAG: hypothetical protein K6G61_07765 [Solobacterium sp.]|nr:hypothetical protein [Solobacterium sp.]
MGWISDHIELLLCAFAVCIFAFRLFTVLKKAKKIDAEGIVTDAVVSRVEEFYDPDTASDSYTTYVVYTDEEGVQRESAMALTQDAEYEEGMHVRIRYLPSEKDMVRIAEDA